MTHFEQPSFSVNPSAAKAPIDCRHGWLDAHRKCVLCGTPDVEKPTRKQLLRDMFSPTDYVAIIGDDE